MQVRCERRRRGSCRRLARVSNQMDFVRYHYRMQQAQAQRKLRQDKWPLGKSKLQFLNGIRDLLRAVLHSPKYLDPPADRHPCGKG